MLPSLFLSPSWRWRRTKKEGEVEGKSIALLQESEQTEELRERGELEMEEEEENRDEGQKQFETGKQRKDRRG